MTEPINIEGVDKAKLLVELCNGTQPIGFGRLNAYEMTLDQARKIIGDLIALGARDLRFDYVAGRPIKVTFTADDKLVHANLYDRDAGPGACAAAIERARRS